MTMSSDLTDEERAAMMAVDERHPYAIWLAAKAHYEAEVERVKKERDKYRQGFEDLREGIQERLDRAQRAEARVKSLEEALSEYAACDGSVQALSFFAQDHGKIARRALATPPPQGSDPTEGSE